MKTKNMKKIVVSTMALVMGAALAGSISGTVAWYQYSTRASVSYIGTSRHSTEAFQISQDGTNWTSNIASSALTYDASHDGSNFSPVTPGEANTGEQALSGTMHGNPKCGNFAYTLWDDADAGAYIQFSFYARVVDIDGDATHVNTIAKDVYISDISLAPKTTGGYTGSDFDEAFRIHIKAQAGEAAATYVLLSKTAGTTDLHGKLDLNNDGHNDMNKDKDKYYEWDENPDTEVNYGGDSAINQVTKAWSGYVADDSGKDLVTTSKTAIGTTIAGADVAAANHIKFTFTIWMEGWAKLANGVEGNADASAESHQVWDVAKYIGGFNFGLQFSVANHTFSE